jgi:hypothetical protein
VRLDKQAKMIASHIIHDWKQICLSSQAYDHCVLTLRAGFEKPSAIQQRAIKPILEGRDVIAQSQSGEGDRLDVILLLYFPIVLCSVYACVRACESMTKLVFTKHWENQPCSFI